MLSHNRFTANERLQSPIHCDMCGSAQVMTKQLSFKDLPPIACFQLKVCCPFAGFERTYSFVVRMYRYSSEVVCDHFI